MSIDAEFGTPKQLWAYGFTYALDVRALLERLSHVTAAQTRLTFRIFAEEVSRPDLVHEKDKKAERPAIWQRMQLILSAIDATADGRQGPPDAFGYVLPGVCRVNQLDSALPTIAQEIALALDMPTCLQWQRELIAILDAKDAEPGADPSAPLEVYCTQYNALSSRAMYLNSCLYTSVMCPAVQETWIEPPHAHQLAVHALVHNSHNLSLEPAQSHPTHVEPFLTPRAKLQRRRYVRTLADVRQQLTRVLGPVRGGAVYGLAAVKDAGGLDHWPTAHARSDLGAYSAAFIRQDISQASGDLHLDYTDGLLHVATCTKTRPQHQTGGILRALAQDADSPSQGGVPQDILWPAISLMRLRDRLKALASSMPAAAAKRLYVQWDVEEHIRSPNQPTRTELYVRIFEPGGAGSAHPQRKLTHIFTVQGVLSANQSRLRRSLELWAQDMDKTLPPEHRRATRTLRHARDIQRYLREPAEYVARYNRLTCADAPQAVSLGLTHVAVFLAQKAASQIDAPSALSIQQAWRRPRDIESSTARLYTLAGCVNPAQPGLRTSAQVVQTLTCRGAPGLSCVALEGPWAENVQKPQELKTRYAQLLLAHLAELDTSRHYIQEGKNTVCYSQADGGQFCAKCTDPQQVQAHYSLCGYDPAVVAQGLSALGNSSASVTLTIGAYIGMVAEGAQAEKVEDPQFKSAVPKVRTEAGLITKLRTWTHPDADILQCSHYGNLRISRAATKRSRVSVDITIGARFGHPYVDIGPNVDAYLADRNVITKTMSEQLQKLYPDAFFPQKVQA